MNKDQFDEKLYLQLYPDVAYAVKTGVFSSGREHYYQYGKKEGRNLKSETDRQAKVFAVLNRNGLGLEIGPSHNPLAPKRLGFNVHILDHATAEELRLKYSEHKVNIDNIEKVDFIWNGESLPDLIGKKNCYDWIIASHVIEHTPDFVRFMQDCEQLLKPDGVLSLVVPDKRFCFDVLGNLTSTGEILDAFEQQRVRPSPGKVFDHLASAANRAGAIAWSALDSESTIGLVHTFDEAINHWQLARSTSQYIDVHNWRFTPASFRLLISDLKQLQLVQSNVIIEFDTVGCEFYVSLGKSYKSTKYDRLSLLRQIAAEQATYKIN